MGTVVAVGARAGWAWFPLTAVQTVAPAAYVQGLPIAWVGRRTGRKSLVAAGVGLSVVGAASVAPVVWARGARARAARAGVGLSGPTLRLAVANTLWSNRRLDALCAAVARVAADADVIALVEVTPEQATAIDAVVDWPHRVAEPRADSEGVGVWSRWPLTDAKVRWFGAHRGIEVTVALAAPMADGTPAEPEATVRLFVVHPDPPLRLGRDDWAPDLDEIRAEALSVDGPVVVAGDVNATRWHPPLGRFLRDGFVDAHEAVGRGWSRSWPTWSPLRLTRLDHVLVKHLVPVAAVEFAVPGSDHDGTLVALRLGTLSPGTG